MATKTKEKETSSKLDNKPSRNIKEEEVSLEVKHITTTEELSRKVHNREYARFVRAFSDDDWRVVVRETPIHILAEFVREKMIEADESIKHIKEEVSKL